MPRSPSKLPSSYVQMKRRCRPVVDALEALGRAVREAGPLNEKSAQLVQLAAAAAIRSEGSVHSHVRRALEVGASPEQIRHVILLLTSTIGFPTVAAAMSWTDDVLGPGTRRARPKARIRRAKPKARARRAKPKARTRRRSPARR